MSPIWSGVYERIGNGNLGIMPTSPVGTILAVGPCSGGTPNKIYYYGKADAGAVRGELGYGDLVERLHDFLSLCGAKSKAIVIPAEKDVPGAVSVADRCSGSGTHYVTSGGDPQMTTMVVTQIVTGGGFDEATFRYSLDGESWSEVMDVPATPGEAVELVAGLQVAFNDDYPSDGSFVGDDSWAWFAAGASCSLTSLLAALNVAKEAKNLPYELGCVFMPTGSATWSGLGSWAEGLFAERHRSIRMLAESPLANPDETANEYVTSRLVEIDGFAHDRVMVCTALVIANDLAGKQYGRGISGMVAGLIAKAPVQASIGDPQLYQLADVLKLWIKDMTATHLQTLDEARYIVPRWYEGMAGWFVNNGNMAANATSDFQDLEVCRVLDNAIRNVRVTALKNIHKKVRVVNGVADPIGLKALEGKCQNTLNGLKDTCSAARIEIPEGQDVLATKTINANISVVPFGYAKAINLNFALAKF